MDKSIFESQGYIALLRNIGVLNTKLCAYKAKECKKAQIADYIEQLYVVTKKLSTKRELIFVDCACGKSYISFAANYILCGEYGFDIKFVCIDYNEELISSCRETAKNLGFENMEFIYSNLSKAQIDVKPDILYCLHACDMATDMTIALGIKSKARNILTMSCCQHTVKDHMRRHPLSAVTKFGVYKERLADMVSDAMRSLIIESNGYKTKLFEFTGKSNTPKNIMLRAVKTGSLTENKKSECIRQYIMLKEMFHAEPGLCRYIDIKSC